METLDLRDARLHVIVSTPGIAGEADEIKRVFARMDPALVLCDADTEDGLRLRRALSSGARFEPGFVDALFAAECERRFSKEPPGEHPVVAAARGAHQHKAAFIVMRPAAKRPGFFARRRAARAAAEITSGAEPRDFARAFAATMRRERVWFPGEDARAAMPRVQTALRDGRAPVVAVVQAHRADSFLAAARSGGAAP